MSDGDIAAFVTYVVAMPVVVVALFVLVCCVLEVVVRRCEVQWRVRVRPEFGPFTRPPNRLQYLVTVHVSYHRHLLHFQLHLYRIYPCHQMICSYTLIKNVVNETK